MNPNGFLDSTTEVPAGGPAAGSGPATPGPTATARTPSRPTPTTGLRQRLAELRGRSVAPRPLDARALAALAANPGCRRRTLLDGAGVDKRALAGALGSPATFGQSQFAHQRGNMFEARVKADGGGELLRLLYERLGGAARGLPAPEPGDIDTPDLTAAGPEGRTARTALALRDATAAGRWALLDHPMVTLDVAGSPVFLEPDAVVVHPDGGWTVIEIKSFPVVDGAADPAKVGAAARQAAVYVLGLERVADRLDDRPGTPPAARPAAAAAPVLTLVPPAAGDGDGDRLRERPEQDGGSGDGPEHGPGPGTTGGAGAVGPATGPAGDTPTGPAGNGSGDPAGDGSGDPDGDGSGRAPAVDLPGPRTAAVSPAASAAPGTAPTAVGAQGEGAPRTGASRVHHRVLLVCPKDFSNLPTAELLDVRKQLAVTRRQLARLTRIEEITAGLPEDLTFDLRPAEDGRTPTRPAAELAAAVDAVEAAYAPECLASCELAFHCRERARAAGSVEALGRGVRGELGGLTTVDAVLAAARRAPAPDGHTPAPGCRTGSGLPYGGDRPPPGDGGPPHGHDGPDGSSGDGRGGACGEGPGTVGDGDGSGRSGDSNGPGGSEDSDGPDVSGGGEGPGTAGAHGSRTPGDGGPRAGGGGDGTDGWADDDPAVQALRRAAALRAEALAFRASEQPEGTPGCR